jgi:uncharacterized protein (TIGR02265 family)
VSPAGFVTSFGGAPHAERLAETLAWVAPHCDIEERLDAVPPAAQTRGTWAKILDRQLEARGLLHEFQRLVPPPSPSGLSFHPVGELLLRAAVAGALVAGPEELERGMFELTRDNAREFSRTLLGRTLLRLLARDPERLTQQVLASRRQTANYGQWEVVERGAGCVSIYLREEYLWIDSYLLGAAVGTYEAVGENVTVEVSLEDRFHGCHTIRW